MGFLLGTQLLIKLGLSLNAYRRSRLEASAKQEKGASSDTAKHEGEGGENSEANDQDEDKETVRLDSLRYTHRSSPPSLVSPPTSAPVVPLSYADPESTPQSNSADEDATHAIARGKAEELEAVAQGVLRCTLCMEQREPEKGTSAVTECGHVFCWECIVGWAREKVSALWKLLEVSSEELFCALAVSARVVPLTTSLRVCMYRAA